MPVRRVAANPSVEADQGRVALQRGPARVRGRVAGQPGRPRAQPAAARQREARHRVPARPAERRPGRHRPRRRPRLRRRGQGRPGSEQDFTAIPYYAWANRGPGEMLVWIPNRETSARPQPLPTLASQATVTSSPAGHNPRGRQRPERAAQLARRQRAPSSTGGPRRAARNGSSTRSTKPSRRLGSGGLLVRRHGQRGVPRAGLLARPLQGRRGVEAGRGRPDPTASRRTATTRSPSSP